MTFSSIFLRHLRDTAILIVCGAYGQSGLGYDLPWVLRYSPVNYLFITVCKNRTSQSTFLFALCFVWISEQTVIISLYSINWLVL